LSEWSWMDFKEGLAYSIPFSSGSKTTDLLTTGETTYIPQNPFGENTDFSTGVVVGYWLQNTLFGFLPFTTMAFVEWRVQAWLFRSLWQPYVVYESARYNYQMAEQIQAALGATEADMVKSSWMLKWGKSGDVGAGGSLPIIPTNPSGDFDMYPGLDDYQDTGEIMFDLINPFNRI